MIGVSEEEGVRTAESDDKSDDRTVFYGDETTH
jgi:hypothetical protein